MVQENLAELYKRDLEKLKKEIESYTNENDIWKIDEGILNSGGNLCLHLIGNLKHFVGRLLGNTSYERQRDKEFSDKNIPQKDLLNAIDETIQIVVNTIQNITNDEMSNVFPVAVFGEGKTTEFILLSLYGHLDYHLGQINYHRRLLNT